MIHESQGQGIDLFKLTACNALTFVVVKFVIGTTSSLCPILDKLDKIKQSADPFPHSVI